MCSSDLMFQPLPQVLGATDTAVANYRLDKKTVARGFPVFSDDKDFSLMVLPGVFDKPVDVSLEKQASAIAYLAYRFKIIQGKAAPIIKKPLAAIFYDIDPSQHRYARVYYYHAPQKMWLGLTTKFDKKRKILVSDKIDFAEGLVGAFVGSAPLPDRIEEADDLQNTATSEKRAASYAFTALFDYAII